MCGCAFKTASRQYLLNQGYSTIIPSNAFTAGNTYAIFMFKKCVSEGKFLNALSKIKLNDTTTLDKEIKTDNDVRKLAEFSETGEDIKRWGVNVRSLLESINYTQEELNNAQCKVGFSKD